MDTNKQKDLEDLFNSYYNKYYKKVYSYVSYRVGNSYCTSHNTEDLVQEVFINIWKGLEGLREKKYMSTWGFRIMANTVKNYYRGKDNGRLMISLESYKANKNGDNNYDGLLNKIAYNTMTPRRMFKLNEFTKYMQYAKSRLSEKERKSIDEYMLNTSSGRGLKPMTSNERKIRASALNNLSKRLASKRELLLPD